MRGNSKKESGARAPAAAIERDPRMPATVAEDLRALRAAVEAGVTVRELAGATGLSQATVARLIAGVPQVQPGSVALLHCNLAAVKALTDRPSTTRPSSNPTKAA